MLRSEGPVSCSHLPLGGVPTRLRAPRGSRTSMCSRLSRLSASRVSASCLCASRTSRAPRYRALPLRVPLFRYALRASPSGCAVPRAALSVSRPAHRRSVAPSRALPFGCPVPRTAVGVLRVEHRRTRAPSGVPPYRTPPYRTPPYQACHAASCFAGRRARVALSLACRGAPLFSLLRPGTDAPQAMRPRRSSRGWISASRPRKSR